MMTLINKQRRAKKASVDDWADYSCSRKNWGRSKPKIKKIKKIGKRKRRLMLAAQIHIRKNSSSQNQIDNCEQD